MDDLNAILATIFGFLKNLPDMLRALLGLLREAPEGQREVLEQLFWVFIALILVKLIFLVSPRDFFGGAYRVIGRLTKAVTGDLAKSLELPRPYPRLRKVGFFVMMVHGYMTCFFSFAWLLVVGMLFLTANPLKVWLVLAGMLLLVLLGYFVVSFFTQAERARLNLFGRQ